MDSSHSTQCKVSAIQESPIDLLPDELVLKILGYLSLPDLAMKLWQPLENNTLRRLCHVFLPNLSLRLWRPMRNKRLRRLCQDTTLCKSITVDAAWDKETARAVVSMAGEKMEELTVAVKEKHDYYFHWNGDIFSNRRDYLCDGVASGKVLSNLLSVISESGNSIALRKINFKTKCTKEFLPFCPISASLLSNASTSLRNLTWIDVQYASVGLGSDTWIKAIADHCTYLEHAALPPLYELNAQLLTYFIERVKGRLKYLAFSGFMITDDDSYTTLKQCQHLEELMIENAWHVGQQGLQAIFELPKLKQLLIANAKELTGNVFAKVLVGKVMSELLCLELYDMSESFDDGTLEMISVTCPNLLGMFLYNSFAGISEVGIRSVLNRCKKLNILYLHKLASIPPPLINDFNCHIIGKNELKTYYYRSKVITCEAWRNVTPLLYREYLTAQVRTYFALKS